VNGRIGASQSRGGHKNVSFDLEKGIFQQLLSNNVCFSPFDYTVFLCFLSLVLSIHLTVLICTETTMILVFHYLTQAFNAGHKRKRHASDSSEQNWGGHTEVKGISPMH
jgi:ABC-type protease/lipase transport system fused ATPase/permease subunit